MTAYRMSAPDGQTYQIDGPSGASDDDVRAEILRQHPSAGSVTGGAAATSRTALLTEAYGRGILPPDHTAAFEEAVKRGVISDPAASAAVDAKARSAQPIQIKAPDGSIAQFPAGTDDATIASVMAKTFGGPTTGHAAQKPKLSAMDTVNGVVDNFLRGTGVGDELAAGWRTGVNTLSGMVPLTANGLGGDFTASMARQRRDEDQFAQAHPIIAGNARGAGIGTTMLAPAGQMAGLAANSSRALNAARGAVTAGLTSAAYAAADRGTPGERLKAAGDAVTNPIVLGLGAAGGALGPSLSSTKMALPKPTTNANLLKSIGVQTTIPQQMGDAAKGIEDLGMRFPIVGQAITGARNRQIAQLNRGVALKALEPIGETLPATVKPGFDMVEHVDKALGATYEKAAALVPKATIDAPFMADLAHIQERAGDLPDTEARQFAGILDNRLSRLSEDSSGRMVKKIHGELGGLQAEAAKKGQDTLSGMLGDTRRALMGIVGRADPEAGKLIDQADKGWQIYSIMNDAAAAASNRGGVFLPGQLNVQVRAAGRRMGSNMTGKGKAPLQDIATAAAKTLPDSFGNPGTANTALLGAGGVGLMTAPVQTAAAGAGLAAAATPYMLTARKIITSLPTNASRSELADAANDLGVLAKKDPEIGRLQAQIAGRLARTGALGLTSPGTADRQDVLRSSR